MPNRGTLAARWWRPGLLAACTALLLWHTLQFHFVTDDAYISFVYSRNLAEHGQLVFNPGLDPVEGFSNFLWTAVLGLFMVVGLGPELMSQVLGFACAAGTLALTVRLMGHLRSDRRLSGLDFVPAVLLALSAGYACWTSGGLETQMFTFWVTGALVSYAQGDEDGRALRRTGVWLALAAMTRPEGLLIAAVMGAHRLAFNVARDRRVRPTPDQLKCVGWFLALWGPYFAWRWWYYGYPLPNTAYVKAGDAPAAYTSKLRAGGAHYVWVWAKQTGLVYAGAPAVLAALIARPRSRWFFLGSLAVPLTAIYLLYTVRVGGDFMGLHRFIMPLFVLAAIAVALAVRRLAELSRWIAGGADRHVALALALVAIGAFGIGQNRLTRKSMEWKNWNSDGGIDTPAFLWVYTHDRAVIGQHMRACMRDSDFSIFGGAGAKPYFGRMRGVDVFGLVSEEIAHEVKPTVPRAGHNKFASNQFLYSTYDPTFVFSCYAIHREAKKYALNSDPGFWLQRGYETVTLHIPGLKQQGEYYTFLKKKSRDFSCPGLVE